MSARRLIAVLIPVFLVSSAAPQRTVTQSGHIEGSVKDRGEAAIPDTRITVESSSTAGPLTARTDGAGNFSVEVPNGVYRVCAKREGFVEKCFNVSVKGGTATRKSFVMSVVPQPPQPSSKLLDDVLRKEGGIASKNCGHVRANGKAEAASQCVLQRFRNHQAFLVRYGLLGVDSEVALGLAGNSEGVTAFVFDSFGTSRDGAPENAVFLSEDHVVAVPCPTPLNLRVSNTGKITCFEPGNEGRWLGLEDY